MDLSRGYLSATISQICDDCENYMDEESENKVEIPTFESIEKSKDLQNTKNKILDNIENSMHTVNRIEKIQQKQWDSVNMTDTDYNSKLYKYAKNKETIDNINKNLRYLHEAVSNSWGIAKSYISDLKNLSNVELSGIPTGYAADIKNVDKEFDRPLNIEINNGKIKIPNIKNYFYYNKINKKLEKEVGDFLHANTSNPKFYGNDIRHQYVSALYTRNLGENAAKQLGNLNEIADPLRGSGSGTQDSKIDQINNEIGRNYGLRYPSVPKEQLLKILLKDWEINHKYTENILNQKK